MAKTAKAYEPLMLKDLQKKFSIKHELKKKRFRTSRLDKLACWITETVGTMGFFLIIFTWSALWLGWNLLAPSELQFDPPMGFVLWLFISNLIQILLMPLILLGQNIQAHQAEARAEYDLEVNMKAEQEIEAVLYHLEYQNSMLIAMLEKLGLNVEEALKKHIH